MRVAAAGAAAALALGGCSAAAPRSAPEEPAGPPVASRDVVRVRLGPAGGGEQATGLRVGPRTVLTVAHALPAGAGPGAAAGSRATVRARDDVADLALLRTGAGRGPAGSTVPAAGPGWRALLLRGGRVVARPAPLRRRVVARVDAPGSGTGGRRPTLVVAVAAVPGDSGAPIVDARGRLVGVLFAVSEDRAATAYAVAVRPVLALLAGPGRR